MNISKQRIVIALVIFGSLLSYSVQAKIWRVNNRPGIQADFTTAQAANDGAVAGDSIFLEPSPTSYGSVNFTKKLTMFGTGYFLSENPETQWKNIWPAYLEVVSFQASSGFSQLMGVTIASGLTISASNITVKRNYVLKTVTIASTASNIVFSGNYCVVYAEYSGFNCGTGNHDILITNNIFQFSSASYYSPNSITGTVTSNGGFINNVIVGNYSNYSYAKLNVDNYLVQNNITSQCQFYTNTNDYTYNLCDNGAFGNLNGNQSVTISSVFINTGSTDGRYQLKSGSPAIAAGYGGTDCGAFGGQNPYVLSGLPPIPAIYDLFIQGGTNNQVNVQVKVKSHN